MILQERHSRQPPCLLQEMQSLWQRFCFVEVHDWNGGGAKSYGSFISIVDAFDVRLQDEVDYDDDDNGGAKLFTSD